jgi:hypothetical protein
MATDPSTVDLHGSASRRPPLEGISSLLKNCRRAVTQRGEQSDITIRSQAREMRAQQKLPGRGNICKRSGHGAAARSGKRNNKAANQDWRPTGSVGATGVARK